MNIKATFKDTIEIFKETFKEFMADNSMKLSASLSYYTIFSLPPLIIIIISLSGIFLGTEAVTGQLFGQIHGLVGNEAAKQIQEMIKNVKLSNGDNIFATIIGVVILLMGASGVFAEIQSSINYMWGIEAKPKKGLLKYFKNRLMSFSMVGALAFLLLVSLTVNSLMDILSDRLTNFLPVITVSLLYVLNIALMFGIITLLFMVIYKTLPDGKMVFKDCLIGAAFTAILFILGKFAIGAYLSNSSIASGYGAAGSIIVILAWVYYSAIILYFGAEFTKVYSFKRGHKITPNEYSIEIKQQKVPVDPKEKRDTKSW